ncbi:hypothetical protein ABK040_015664 [Willaertia magna]
MRLLRRLVSKKKKRLEDKEHDFDLDLAYVTPRIIAMGYPSEKIESIFRNPLEEVQRFLEMHHKGKYKLWNLCAERAYNKGHFHGRVEDRYQFYDHEAPKFEIMVPLVQSVKEWLDEHPDNVAVVHCKAGKGRTGVCIASYLLFSQEQPSAITSLDYYAKARTKNQKGVTIPSQRRYVYYLERVLNENNKNQINNDSTSTTTIMTKGSNLSSDEENIVISDNQEHAPELSHQASQGSSIIEMVKGNNNNNGNDNGNSLNYTLPHPKNTCLRLKQIIITPPPFKESTLNFTVLNSSFEKFFDYKKKNGKGVTFSPSDNSIVFDCDVLVTEDTKIVFKKKKSGRYGKFFSFWFNTHFIDKDQNNDSLYRLQLDKSQLDKIYRDTKHKKLPENFKIECIFEDSTNDDFVDITH